MRIGQRLLGGGVPKRRPSLALPYHVRRGLLIVILRSEATKRCSLAKAVELPRGRENLDVERAWLQPSFLYDARPNPTLVLAASVVAILFATSTSALCQIPQALIDHQPSIAVTKQTGTFGGQSVAYTTIVEENILKGADSVPNAFLVTIAYVRDGVSDQAKRPVAFVFNGGPALRHRRFTSTASDRASPIAAPSSTIRTVSSTRLISYLSIPWARASAAPYTTEIGRQFYWNLNGDAASVKEVVARWLKTHRREASPRYLIGESYGATRISAILRNHKDLKFDGVVLISALGGNPPQPYVAYARNLPSMAVSAWYHEKVPRAGRSVGQMWNEAVAFATNEYTAALARGRFVACPTKRIASPNDCRHSQGFRRSSSSKRS
jgi:hypothetical protein